MRAHQYCSDQKKIVEEQSAQISTRVVVVAYRLWLPLLINRVLRVLSITNADKGGVEVIMDVEKYINEADRQLSDKRNYKNLQEDPTLQHSDLVNDIIDRFKKENLLSKKLADGLKSVNPKTPKFYISPKIHKENNPGRPVINSINCHTSEISRFVDHHLQPLVREIPSYIKDTNDFINKIDNFAVPPNSFLITMDVKSLHK